MHRCLWSTALLFVSSLLSATFAQATCSVSFSLPATVAYGQSFTVNPSWSGVRVVISGDHNQGNVSGAGVSMFFGSQSGWTGNRQTSNTLAAGSTQTISWGCSDVNGSNHGSKTFKVGPAPPDGYISPKYAILSVIYAPPGANSSVDYGTSTNLGTSTSLNSSFTSSTSVSVTVQRSIGLPSIGIFGVNVKGPTATFGNTSSTTDSVEQDTSSSVAFNKITSTDLTVLGPASSAVGLDHDFDIVKIWLNPVLHFTIPSTNALQLTNYYFDDTDPCNCMDVVELTVGQLKNPSLINNQAQLNQLARAWAPNLSDGSGPGLTSADLLAIATADPFSNPSYVASITAGQPCTTDGRFCQSANTDIQFASPQQGGQGGTTTYSQTYTATATQGQSVKDTHETAYSVDTSVSGGFLSGFSLDIKKTNTLTWTNQWSSQTSKTASQMATAKITSPTYTDNYTGPTEFAIYQDNVYGTFMLLPIPFPGFILSAGPASQSTTPGQNASYTVSTAVVDGFSGNVSFSVASGLPAGASAAFSPASGPAGGTSVLTVTTSSSTPAGTYTLNINATSGTNLPHSTLVTLVVNATPDFSLSASPTSQSVIAGGNTTYTLSTTALNGFSGSVSLTLVGLPSGASATFSPTSITGSGSSTLTVTTSSSTPAGGYTLTITGTSGSLTHTASVTLVVTAPAPDFSLSVTPQSQGITRGGSAVYTVSTSALNGFSGSVALTLVGLPSGASATFSPTSITGGGSSTLTVTTTSSTPVGNSTLTITGTSGSLTHTTVATLTVN